MGSRWFVPYISMFVSFAVLALAFKYGRRRPRLIIALAIINFAISVLAVLWSLSIFDNLVR